MYPLFGFITWKNENPGSLCFDERMEVYRTTLCSNVPIVVKQYRSEKGKSSIRFPIQKHGAPLMNCYNRTGPRELVHELKDFFSHNFFTDSNMLKSKVTNEAFRRDLLRLLIYGNADSQLIKSASHF